MNEDEKRRSGTRELNGAEPVSRPSGRESSLREWVFFSLSLVIAIWYGMRYWGHEIGVSPFHISKKEADLDRIVLTVTVILPLLFGIGFGLFAGRLKWWVVPLYVVVIVASLV